MNTYSNRREHPRVVALGSKYEPHASRTARPVGWNRGKPCLVSLCSDPDACASRLEKQEASIVWRRWLRERTLSRLTLQSLDRLCTPIEKKLLEHAINEIRIASTLFRFEVKMLDAPLLAFEDALGKSRCGRTDMA